MIELQISTDIELSSIHWHKIWYLVSYGILCHNGSFLDDTSYE